MNDSVTVAPLGTSRRLPHTYTRAERAMKFVQGALADPVEVARYVPEYWLARTDRVTAYTYDPDWLRVLHRRWGVDEPCACRAEVQEVWDQIAVEMASAGLPMGRFTYGNFSDGDRDLATAVWAAVIHSAPDIVVETGVARGVTSRIVLEALHRLGHGRLWSIDLPHLFEREARATTGAVVPRHLRNRWRLIEGSSRRRLPALLNQLGDVDVFVHDSLHTARNVLFEMNRVADVLASNGVMIVDDITEQDAFATFTAAHPQFDTIACRSADSEGAFGIAVRAQ